MSIASVLTGNSQRLPSDTSSETSDPLNLQDDEGWDDVSPDDGDDTRITCLWNDTVLPDIPRFLSHCREEHGYDMVTICRELGVTAGLDFYGTIRLINYIRSEVKTGNTKPDVSEQNKTAWVEDERYLRPALEDDALLFSVDEILEAGKETTKKGAESGDPVEDVSSARRVAELEEELQRVQSQFTDYRLTVKKTLEERLEEPSSSAQPASAPIPKPTKDGRLPHQEDDSHYFTSYAYNDIHETMLKDEIRTASYRDFIYLNKALFRGKTVLDIGCGTGILSLFCARAGATRVIAVDNSDIIDKCRENVFENGLQGVITCLRGKVEEVHLPVPKVDIIVSEWMGYCLLYEAMLDSVLWARDRYLVQGGLMVPSCTTIHLAPVADPEYIAEHVDFWRDVYGFKMSSMMKDIEKDILIRHLSPDHIVGSSTEILHLDLHTATVEDLTFSHPFTITMTRDVDTLDAWTLWFDTFFSTSPAVAVPRGTHAEEWSQKEDASKVGFTTGPGGVETHWRQGVLLVDHGKDEARAMTKGAKVQGVIGYRKREANERELDVDMRWEGGGGEDEGKGTAEGKGKWEKKQMWCMR
ncbi:MAG: hypothetical protein M1817_001937 [Caeruleum heppii]|nr:MAG: hypothetical protein M1817_001937 [Caeruleum heppii]